MTLSLVLIAAAAVIGGVVAAGARLTFSGLLCAGVYFALAVHGFATHNLVQVGFAMAFGLGIALIDLLDRRREKAAA